MLGAAILGALATRPLGTVPISLPVPDPSAFLIGSAEPGLGIGDLAPELTFTDASGATVPLTDLDGNPIRLADLRGKVVWINFWASWCPPCQYETPTLRSMDQRYRDRGLAIVGINVQQTVDVGRDYAQRYSLGYTIGADVTGKIFHTYRVFALPTQFFIGTDGRLRAIVNGPLDDQRAASAIEALLPPLPSGAATTAPGPTGP
ncbi:MAG TPA: TlpA disulfide reductase family protein, partial [Candidatus Limnocylindrales bacterium]|nr:TlpA disulfide reductase family protein [Candidatus Limnocylindrales bacterium]